MIPANSEAPDKKRKIYRNRGISALHKLYPTFRIPLSRFQNPILRSLLWGVVIGGALGLAAGWTIKKSVEILSRENFERTV